MRFWFSGELDHRIADDYHVIRQELEASLNDQLGGNDYGGWLEEIAIIPMILRPEFAEGRLERRLIKRAAKIADYRLRIDFDAWAAGSKAERRALLLRNVLASIDDIARKLGKKFDGRQLHMDIVRIFPDLANKIMEPTR